MFRGDRLKSLRERKGIVQENLAKVLQITKGSISRYETGIRDPDCQSIVKIATYFNVTTDYLLGKSDTENIPNSNTKMPLSEINYKYLKLAEKMQDAKLDADIVDSMLNTLIKMKK